MFGKHDGLRNGSRQNPAQRVWDIGVEASPPSQASLPILKLEAQYVPARCNDVDGAHLTRIKQSRCESRLVAEVTRRSAHTASAGTAWQTNYESGKRQISSCTCLPGTELLVIFSKHKATEHPSPEKQQSRSAARGAVVSIRTWVGLYAWKTEAETKKHILV